MIQENKGDGGIGNKKYRENLKKFNFSIDKA